eukprot:m.81669 g.81669  ORF g.81669 m.81669 type:complete len:98 (-) comp8650_c0_seq3:449-742(-)
MLHTALGSYGIGQPMLVYRHDVNNQILKKKFSWGLIRRDDFDSGLLDVRESAYVCAVQNFLDRLDASRFLSPLLLHRDDFDYLLDVRDSAFECVDVQ